jgi:hypothetical protein
MPPYDPRDGHPKESAMAQQRRSDLDVLTEDDHARGCQGREYICTCGYDERLAAHVRRVERELVALCKVVALELGWDRMRAIKEGAREDHMADDPGLCDCCRRLVADVRGSMWHGHARICAACFYVWYDGGSVEDPTDPQQIAACVLKAEAANTWPFGPGGLVVSESRKLSGQNGG